MRRTAHGHTAVERLVLARYVACVLRCVRVAVTPAGRHVMFRRRALRRRLAGAGAGSVPDEQLRLVARALDAGASGAACAPCPLQLLEPLRLAVLRAFRYPELRDLAELRRLPLCPDRLCCNPYHWSRLCKPGTSRPMTRATSASNCRISRVAPVSLFSK